MNDYDSEEINEMLEQVIRYENSKLSGVKIWFDSDNYIDIIDWYYLNDMNDKATQAIKEAYALFNDNEEIISRYAGMCAWEGNFQEAISIVEEAIKKNPSDDLYTDLAALYIDSDSNTDKAADILHKLIQKNRTNYYNFFLLGKIYLENNNNILAEKYLRKAIQLETDDKLLLGYYTDCATEESLQETMTEFLHAVAIAHPFNDMAWTALGIVYAKYGLYEKAVEAFDLAIAIKPEGEIRHSCKADCLIAQNDYEGAEKELLIAIDNCSSDACELHIVLADIYIHKKNFRQALIHLLHVKNNCYDSADKNFLLDLALCYYYNDNPQQAWDCILDAIKEQVPVEFIIDFARRLHDHGFFNESDELFAYIHSHAEDDYSVELSNVTLAALKTREGDITQAVNIMRQTINELHSCTEDFWYAFLRITCSDKKYNNDTVNTIRLLMTLDSFPDYIKNHYPEILDNTNYKYCLKEIINA